MMQRLTEVVARGGLRVVVGAAGLTLITAALSSCGQTERSNVPYSQWTRCPAQARFSEQRWSSVDGVNEQMNDYAWRHHCTFPFTGSDPNDIVWFHNHPNSD